MARAKNAPPLTREVIAMLSPDEREVQRQKITLTPSRSRQIDDCPASDDRVHALEYRNPDRELHEAPVFYCTRCRTIPTLGPTPQCHSGSTLTTILNNGGSQMVALELHKPESLARMRAADDLAAEIVRIARQTGYTITAEVRDRTNVMFLKHRFYPPGVPALAFGVYLRAMGRCRGDLAIPRDQSFAEAARRFNGGLFHGMYPHIRIPELEFLRYTGVVSNSVATPSAGKPTNMSDANPRQWSSATS